MCIRDSLAGSQDGLQFHSVIRLEVEFVGWGSRTTDIHHMEHRGTQGKAGTADHAEKSSLGGGDLVSVYGCFGGAGFRVGGEGESNGQECALVV